MSVFTAMVDLVILGVSAMASIWCRHHRLEFVKPLREVVKEVKASRTSMRSFPGL